MDRNAIDSTALDELRSQVRGAVLTPGDPDYAKASQPWDLTLKQEPALVVCAAGRDDVIAAVRFASRMHLQISVVNTGHGTAEPANGAMLLNVSQMNGVRIDLESQTAWMEAGSLWRDVLDKAQEAGLAPPMGSSSDIGAVGYTLLGGIGWLSRKFGLALDHVLAFEVVTADGELIQANENEHADLFWALRGAGAAYGVVTAMKIELLPVKTVFAGNLVYPPELTEDVLRRYREWLEIIEPQVGDSFSTGVLIANFPMIESLPPFLRGRSAVVVRGCLAGTAEQGAELLRHWRDWKAPLVDQFREMPFTDVDTISQDPREPLPTFVSNFTVQHFSDALIASLSRHVLAKGRTPLLSFIDVRQAGGAIARVPAEATAFSQRDAAFVITMVAVARDGVTAASFATATDQVKVEASDQEPTGVYLNFLNGPDKWVLTPDAFSADGYRRLIAIKRQYDPENRFSFSLDIPPMEIECCQI